MTLPLPDPIKETKVIAQVILALVCVLGLMWLVWSNMVLRTQVAQQNAEITDYQGANQNWADQATQCNQAVDKIKADADARLANAQKVIAAMAQKAGKISTNATSLMVVKPSTSDNCAATKDFIAKYYGAKP